MFTSPLHLLFSSSKTFSLFSPLKLIRDIFPVDGPSHARLDMLELSMSIRIFDLGKESQVSISLLIGNA